MKASELRIGNWFKEDMTLGGFSQITAEQILDLYDDPLDDFYQPIPLTEDWLLKFGFESDGIEWWNGVLSLGIYKDGLYYCPTEDIHYRLGKEFKYVHQLQNLHHALTDEELIIKE
jgi:hypothetical protein